MKTSKLKLGMIVEYRDGRRRMVFTQDDKLKFKGYRGNNSSLHYNDDLLDKDGDSGLDIVKVWSSDCFMLRDIDGDLGTPIWTRDPVIKLSIDGKDVVLSKESEESIRQSLK